tara:strand:- start:4529 stop:5572 length:1044 start_codon:yes stop_codon:yes gene_type:complete
MSKKVKKVEVKNEDEISNENIYIAFQLERLTQNFVKVIDYYNNSIEIQKNAQSTVDELLNIYKKLIENNKRKDQLFCLDSFYFQYKIFNTELENLNNLRMLFSNRLYCEYYKLYMLMISDLKDMDLLSQDEYKTNKYENYKDLEPYKQYSIDDVKSMNKEITFILNKLCIKYTKTSNYINNYNKNNNVGYSISNFLNSINYENNTLLEKITLYKNFIVFFDVSHIRNFDKLIKDYNRFTKNMIENISSPDYLSVNNLDDGEDLLNLDNNDDIEIKQDNEIDFIEPNNIVELDFDISNNNLLNKKIFETVEENSLKELTGDISFNEILDQNSENGLIQQNEEEEEVIG